MFVNSDFSDLSRIFNDNHVRYLVIERIPLRLNWLLVGSKT